MGCTSQGAEVWPISFAVGQSSRRALQVNPSVRRACGGRRSASLRASPRTDEAESGMNKKAIAATVLLVPVVSLVAIALARTPPEIAALNEGSEASVSGRYDEALRRYDAAIAAAPRWNAAHCARGEVLIKMKRYREATESFRECIRLEPRDLDGKASLTIALLYACDYAAAQVALNEVDRVKGTQPRALQNADWVRVRLRRAAGLGGRCLSEREVEAS